MSEIGEALDAYTAVVAAKGFVLKRDTGGPIQNLPAQDRISLAQWPRALAEFFSWSNGAHLEKDGEQATFGFFIRFCSLQEAIADFEISVRIEDKFERHEPLPPGALSQALFPVFNANASGHYWYGFSRSETDDLIFLRDLEGGAEPTGLSLIEFIRLLHRVLADPKLGLLDRLAQEPDDPIAMNDFSAAFDDAWRSALTGVPPEPRQSDEFYAQQAEAAIASVPREMLARIEQLGSKDRERAYKLLGRIGPIPRPIPVTREDFGDDET